MTQHDRRVLRSSAFVPVEAKLRRPSRPGPQVARESLLRLLLDLRDIRVVHIVAPAGYGKTVLLGQWQDRDTRPFAWLTVDTDDDDADVVATYVLMALNRVSPVGPDLLEGLDVSRQAPGKLAQARIRAELPSRDPFVLIVENADVLRSPGARQVLSQLAAQIPAGSQLVLTGRGPSLPDATVDPLNLGVSQLRFDRAEAAALLEAVDLRLGDHTLDQIFDRTEGWPSAVYLATRATTWEGALPVLADFFREEVLRAIPARDASFLLRTSVVDELTGAVCDELVGSKGSAQRLRRLETLGLVLRTAPHEERFRANAALRQVLHAQLQGRSPSESAELHDAAALWFEGAGDLAQATEQAVASGDVLRTGRLMWAQAPLLVATGHLDLVQARLDVFGPRQVSGNAHLALTAAWCALASGTSADHWLAAAQKGDYEEDRAGAVEALAASVAVVRGLLARDGIAQMVADGQLATRLLDPGDPLGCTAQLLVAVGTYLASAEGPADAMLAVTASVAAASGAYDVEVMAVALRALIASDRGEPGTAQALAAAVSQTTDRRDLQSLATLLPARCVLAALSARLGEADAAEAVRRAAAELAGTSVPPWASVLCLYLLADAQLCGEDPAAARSLLAQAQQLHEVLADAPSLRLAVERTWQRLQACASGESDPAVLTAAELRVLQFLPTYLSFEEIGRRLFLSRNTVKTQAVAAYRKLGVSSRSAAVARADAIGLIQFDGGDPALQELLA